VQGLVLCPLSSTAAWRGENERLRVGAGAQAIGNEWVNNGKGEGEGEPEVGMEGGREGGRERWCGRREWRGFVAALCHALETITVTLLTTTVTLPLPLLSLLLP